MKKYQEYDLEGASDYSDIDETMKNVDYAPVSSPQKIDDGIVDLESADIPELPPDFEKQLGIIELYDSSEHDMIGEKAFEIFSQDLNKMGLLELFIQYKCMNKAHEWIFPHHQLNFGKIIALAGDYFGIAELPICEGRSLEEQKERFRKAYSTLVKARHWKVEKLKKVIDKDIVEYYKKVDAGEIPTIGIGSYVKLATIAGLPLTVFNSLHLASQNFDHFGPDAVIAYKAGHRIAIDTAIEAGQYPPDSKDRYETLAMAFTMELFACHFLSDLFASGHVRTPRRQLFNHVQDKIIDQLTEELDLLGRTVTGSKGKWIAEWLGKKIGKSLPGIHLIAGFLAKAMHDEDNNKGLNVESPNSQKDEEFWKTYGDACYFKIHENDRLRIAEAIVSGLRDVLMFYDNPNLDIEDNITSDKNIPITPPNPELNPDFKPLFKVVNDDTVHLRPHLVQTKCEDKDYRDQWSIRYTCAELLARNFFLNKFKKKEEEFTPEEKEEYDHSREVLKQEIADLYGEHIGKDLLEVGGENRSCTLL